MEILEELGRASRTHSEKRDAVSASLPSFRTAGAVFALLSGLSMLAYSRSVQLPFIADDYAQIQLARDDGPASGWGALAADALYRCRATSLVLTYWTTLWLNRYPVRGTASFRQPSFFRRIVQNLPYFFQQGVPYNLAQWLGQTLCVGKICSHWLIRMSALFFFFSTVISITGSRWR